jgi:hypothetical protein
VSDKNKRQNGMKKNRREPVFSCPRSHAPRRLALGPVGAVVLRAIAIQRQGVFLQRKAAFARNALLALLDVRVEKFLDSAAIQAHQMVMVLAFIQLENRLAGFKVVA